MRNYFLWGGGEKYALYFHIVGSDNLFLASLMPIQFFHKIWPLKLKRKHTPTHSSFIVWGGLIKTIF